MWAPSSQAIEPIGKQCCLNGTANSALTLIPEGSDNRTAEVAPFKQKRAHPKDSTPPTHSLLARVAISEPTSSISPPPSPRQGFNGGFLSKPGPEADRDAAEDSAGPGRREPSGSAAAAEDPAGPGRRKPTGSASSSAAEPVVAGNKAV